MVPSGPGMPSDDFYLGLAYRHADGAATEEAWQFFSRASLDAALAAARCDGHAGAFGRTFLGVATVESFDEHGDWTTRPLPAARIPSLADLDAKLAASGLDLARFAEPTLAGPSPEAVERTPWWQWTCAFGPGALVGVLLRRCLAVDTAVAKDAANIAGECIAHQGTLYPVTPAAVGAIVELLGRAETSPSETLRNWLEVIATRSVDDIPEEPEAVVRKKYRRALKKEGSSLFLLDTLVPRHMVHAAAVRGCRAAFASHAAKLAELGRAGLVGEAACRLAQSLGEAAAAPR